MKQLVYIELFHLSQVLMVEIFSFTICRKSSPIVIWLWHFYHLVMSFRPKCSLTNKPICRNVLALYHMTMQPQLNRPSRRCTVFKLAPKDLKYNWNGQKMQLSHIKSIYRSIGWIRTRWCLWFDETRISQESIVTERA